MLLELKSPDPRTILRTGDNLYIYNPGLKRVEEYNLGKNRALVDQFLLLGFGTDSQEMKKGYLDHAGGGRQNRRSSKTDPAGIDSENRRRSAIKSPRSRFGCDEASWLPVQQQFFESGSGDYSIVKYTKIVRNPGLPDLQFKPHWPKGTEKIKPQG